MLFRIVKRDVFEGISKKSGFEVSARDETTVTFINLDKIFFVRKVENHIKKTIYHFVSMLNGSQIAITEEEYQRLLSVLEEKGEE